MAEPAPTLEHARADPPAAGQFDLVQVNMPLAQADLAGVLDTLRTKNSHFLIQRLRLLTRPASSR
jgi:hypothetical protein